MTGCDVFESNLKKGIADAMKRGFRLVAIPFNPVMCGMLFNNIVNGILYEHSVASINRYSDIYANIIKERTGEYPVNDIIFRIGTPHEKDDKVQSYRYHPIIHDHLHQ